MLPREPDPPSFSDVIDNGWREPSCGDEKSGFIEVENMLQFFNGDFVGYGRDDG